MSCDKDSNEQVARALYAALIGGKHSLKAVAAASGISTDRLYKACQNKLTIPASWLPRLYAATRDPELIASLLGFADLGLVLSERPVVQPSGEAPATAAMRVGASVGKAQLAVVTATARLPITADEKRQINQRIDEIAQEAERLRHAIEAAS